uniref:Uncharacterized protein n=1 Tax=Peromyscus maniculatus bairdii TaxID=230844 RepID=A0A8C8U1W5_PERMB
MGLVVLVSQGSGHTRHHLLIGRLCSGGEVLAQVVGNHGQTHQTHLEVLRIHMQFVTVELTQASKGALEVVQVFQAFTKGVNHLLAMGLHLGITHDSRGRGKVSKAVKEPLGPRVDSQQFHLSPQAGDQSLLSISQVHHGVCFCGCKSTQQYQKQM